MRVLLKCDQRGAREEDGRVEGMERKLNGHHLSFIPGLCLKDEMIRRVQDDSG